MGYCDKEKNKKKWICRSVVNPIKKTASNIVKKASSVLKDAGDIAKYAVLLPFKPMMVSVLKKKGEGVNLSTPMKTLAPLFYERVILKKTKVNYESYENLDPVSIGAIIGAILDFIKGLQKSKDEGQPLDAEQTDILSKSNEAATEVVKTESEVTLKSNWFKENKFLVIGVLAVIVFVAIKKK
jgi:hypothetical protein